jgi:nucleotide-binding universal stress UspA family protein
MNLSALCERIVGGPQNRADALPATKDMTRLLGAHRRVLLVLDRTVDPDTALRNFAARAEGAPIDAVALVVLPAWSARRLELTTKAHVRRIAEEVTSPTIHLSAEVRLGEPVATVLDTAARLCVDLIAMTVPRAGVLDRFLDGSILEEVLRRAPVPVVALPAPVQAS